MTFAEQVSGLTRRFGRRTERLRSTLVSVVLRSRAGPAPDDGRPQGSGQPDTLLRLIALLPDPATAVPRVVGVDEYAQRKDREPPSLRRSGQHLERDLDGWRGAGVAEGLRRLPV